jgi:uncharacterized membrane protein YbhN (UPF0104 family)
MAALLHRLTEIAPGWLWLSGAGFLAATVAAAGCWRAAIELCGGRTSLLDATARFGVGSLVNTFVPARAGDAVRIGLFRRVVPNRSLLATGGAFAASGAAHVVALAAIVFVGALAGAVPLWPLLVAAGVVAAACVAAVLARRRTARFLDAFRALAADPRAGLRLVGWHLLSSCGRLAAAAAIAAGLGIHQPLAAAIIVVPALDLTGLVPITPGNIGITSGAVAVALEAHGVSFHAGLAAGIAFHAVETAAGILVGLLGALWLTPRAVRVRRLATAASAVALAAAFSATVLLPLV